MVFQIKTQNETIKHTDKLLSKATDVQKGFKILI